MLLRSSIDIWSCAALSQDVGSKPLESTVLGVSLVLFRDEANEAVALSNVCSHRGAPLHESELCGCHEEGTSCLVMMRVVCIGSRLIGEL